MKNFFKKYWGLSGLLLIATVAVAAGVGDNFFRIGDKTGSDIEIGMGSGRLKWDDAGSKMQFSNNAGGLYADISSGGGSAVVAGAALNILNDDNPGFETDLTGWSNVGGGTLTATTTPATDLGVGAKSGRYDAAAISDRMDGTAITIPAGLYGRTCTVEMLYKGGDANLKMQAYDGTVVVKELVLAVATNYTHAAISFTCPTSGTLQFRIEATADAAEILVDETFIGGGVVKYDVQVFGIEAGIQNKVCKFHITLNGASCVLDENDGCVDFLDNCSAGIARVNWTTSYFANTQYRVRCTTLETTTSFRGVVYNNKSTSTIDLKNISDTGALNNDPIDCIVTGE